MRPSRPPPFQGLFFAEFLATSTPFLLGLSGPRENNPQKYDVGAANGWGGHLPFRTRLRNVRASGAWAPMIKS